MPINRANSAFQNGFFAVAVPFSAILGVILAAAISAEDFSADYFGFGMRLMILYFFVHSIFLTANVWMLSGVKPIGSRIWTYLLIDIGALLVFGLWKPLIEPGLWFAVAIPWILIVLWNAEIQRRNLVKSVGTND